MARSNLGEEGELDLPKVPSITPTIDELKITLKSYRDKIPELSKLTDKRLEEILDKLYQNSYNADGGAKLKIDLDNLLDEIVEEIYSDSD
jgi:hypothetical protein